MRIFEDDNGIMNSDMARAIDQAGIDLARTIDHADADESEEVRIQNEASHMPKIKRQGGRTVSSTIPEEPIWLSWSLPVEEEVYERVSEWAAKPEEDCELEPPILVKKDGTILQTEESEDELFEEDENEPIESNEEAETVPAAPKPPAEVEIPSLGGPTVNLRFFESPVSVEDLGDAMVDQLVAETFQEMDREDEEAARMKADPVIRLERNALIELQERELAAKFARSRSWPPKNFKAGRPDFPPMQRGTRT